MARIETFLWKETSNCYRFGRDRENEYKEDLHKISDRLHGNRGLLFTDRPKEEVIKYFKLFSETAYAHTGDIATETIKLDAGPLEQFSHALEPRLRDLGLTTSLKKGVIHLEKDFTVCEEGKPVTADGAAILRLLELELAEFKLTLEAMWSGQNGYVELEPPEAMSRKRKMLSQKRQDQQDKAARKAGKEVAKKAKAKKSKAKKTQQASVEMEQEESEEDDAELESEDELEAQLN